MNRINMIVVIILVICGHSAIAQEKKEKKKEKAKTEDKVPVYNYVIDDPMDAFGRNPDTPALALHSFSDRGTLLFPDFYSYTPTTSGDTSYRYLCYDRRDSLINVDTLHDINAVRYISLFISFPDHQHTYRNAQGQLLPLPINRIIKRYDKLGTDKWMSIDYTNNKYIELQENKSTITRTEIVTITDLVTHTQSQREHKYYMVK